MSHVEISATALEALRSSYDIGVVILYSLPTVHESIILRTVTSDGGEPREGTAYIVEFRDSKTDELQEVLVEEDNRRFDSTTIKSVMDNLAEEYLRSNARDWETYVMQSGRCGPNEINRGEAESGYIEQVIIRNLPA